MEIYKHAELDEIAYAALDRIRSQQVLRDLLRDYRWRDRKDFPKILARINDVSLLKDIVQEDKNLLMDMLQRGDKIRIKAAEILAQDETMRDYSFCPYCGRPASSISYGYRGLFSDMFYYGWSCPCGHTNSLPEGYGEPDSFAVTIAEFAEDPERYKA